MKNRKFFIYLALVIICIITFFPFYWLIVSSLQSLERSFSYPPSFLPDKPPISSYIAFIKESPIMLWIRNTIVVASVSSFLSVFLGLFAGYSISRFKFRGKVPTIFLILLTQMLPPAFLVIPIYFMFSQMYLTDSLFALMIIYTALSMPISIWFLKGFFDSISRDIEDAARIDGASRVGVLFKVLFPLITPGVVATATWSFVMAWNQYIYAATLVTSEKLWVVSFGLTSYMGEYYTETSQIMSGAVLATIPTVILFMFFQRFLVGGLTAGSIKG